MSISIDVADNAGQPWRPVIVKPPAEVSRWLARAGGLLLAAIAGMVALAIVAQVLASPLSAAASQGVAVQLAVPETAALAPLDQRSVVYAADGSVLTVLHDEVDRKVVPLAEIPEHVQHAVLVSEDRRFYEHDGYDVEGIGRAFVANWQAQGVIQGGSTITQQLAKQNFTGAERSLERKASELLYAIALEQRFTKDELLERYLNQVYLGRGAYGIAAAAEEFFGVSPTELTVDQAALLAGVIRAPERLNPRERPDAAALRRNWVLQGMADEGYLSQAQADRYIATPLEVLPHRPKPVREPYIIEAVKREFFANPAFGPTRQERIELLFSGGLAIHTSIQPHLQQVADETMAAVLPQSAGEPGAMTAAIASIDPRTGKVLSLHSGAEFSEEQFDLATQGRRQPGSSFKPFVLAAALESGLPLDMRISGSGPLYVKEPGWAEAWKVSNYGGASYGRVNLRTALVKSINTAFAQLIMTVGVDNVVDLTTRLGIDHEQGIGAQYGPAIALGALQYGATPLEMASAYGVFANNGQRHSPHIIERVTGPHGKEIYTASSEPEQVLCPAVASTMVDVMQDVVSRGTARAARIPEWSPAGKTGTTQNYADAWFVGATPVAVTAVWVGHPQGQVSMPGVTGGSYPARVWREYMTQALAGVQPVPWPEPDGQPCTTGQEGRVSVPDVRGKAQTEALVLLTGADLAPEIHVVSASAPAGTVVWQNPQPGSTVPGGSKVKIGVSSGSASRPRVRSAPAPPKPAPPPPPPPPPEPPAQGDAAAQPQPPPDQQQPPAQEPPAQEEPAQQPPAQQEPQEPKRPKKPKDKDKAEPQPNPSADDSQRTYKWGQDGSTG